MWRTCTLADDVGALADDALADNQRSVVSRAETVHIFVQVAGFEFETLDSLFLWQRRTKKIRPFDPASRRPFVSKPITYSHEWAQRREGEVALRKRLFAQGSPPDGNRAKIKETGEGERK